MSPNSTLIDTTSQSEDSTTPGLLTSRGTQTDPQLEGTKKPKPKRYKRKSTKTGDSKPKTIRKVPDRHELLRVYRLDITGTDIDKIVKAPIWTTPSMELPCLESTENYARVYGGKKEMLDATRAELDMAREEELNSTFFATNTEFPKIDTSISDAQTEVISERIVCEPDPAADLDSVTKADSKTESCCAANPDVPSTWAYMSQPSMPRNVGSIGPPSLATQLPRKPLWERAEAHLENAALVIDPTLRGEKLAAEVFRLSMVPLEQRLWPPEHRPWTHRTIKDAWSSLARPAGRNSQAEEGGGRELTSKMISELRPDDLPTSVDPTLSAASRSSRTETKA